MGWASRNYGAGGGGLHGPKPTRRSPSHLGAILSLTLLKRIHSALLPAKKKQEACRDLFLRVLDVSVLPLDIIFLNAAIMVASLARKIHRIRKTRSGKT